MRKILLIALLCIGVVMHLMIGKVYIPPFEIIQCFQLDSRPISCEIIYHVRLPRTILAVIIGATLAISGYILQQVSQNPIFEPGILGVNAGALFMMTTVQLLTGIITNTLLIMIVSFTGGLVVLLLIYILTRLTNYQQSIVPILGLLIGQFLTSIVYFILLMRSDVASDVISKTFGSLNGTTMEDVYVLLPFAVISFMLVIVVTPNLKYFNLNQEVLMNIGFPYKKWTIIMLMIAILLASITVPIIGTIGFVGLISPHIGQKLSKQRTIIFSGLVGALILLLSDVVSAGIFIPALKNVNIPLGAILSVIGVPYFIMMYLRNRKAYT
ncbi:FecCD family ABC transporter permease [Macrococcoides bohemicum]|uniref:FecCD family ABC transporter permease n=1 Tax=Macrococcoides bohemicum TaxID=1903056 RepID=UPI00165E1061|nr:iron ABC transporter permease [Macrococcus bohemicus]MBC9874859.1 iron ABC transporter permease [Macrococcus bohemicus]